VTVYTLFGQGAAGSLVSDASVYTFGMQFSLSQDAALTGIWWYSAADAASLPTACVIYAVTGQAKVSGTENDSPTWSGAAGSGWVKCAYDGSITLTASTAYKVCAFNANGGDGNWYSVTSHYWDTGTGSGGLTSGIITAPDNAGADGGQDAFSGDEALDYPDTSFNAGNYWLDVQVTVSSPPDPPSGHVRSASPAAALAAAEVI
jgi:hypothetical protein